MGKPIEKLTIRGFKSIRALEDLELRPLNVLIGANGAGKTNFLSFFAMLAALVEQDLQGYVAQHGGADAHLFLGPKVTQEIVGELHFPPNRYGFKLKRSDHNELYFAYEKVGWKANTETLGRNHKESKLKERKAKRGRLGGRSIANWAHESLAGWTAYHFHDTSATAPVRSRPWTIRDIDHLRPDASNLAPFLLNLCEVDRSAFEQVRETLQLVAPFFDDFMLRPRRNGSDEAVLLEWRQKGTNYPFHPSQLSDGTLRFLCLAAALLQPSLPATMLFDEPELGLHPYALAVLAGLFRQAASRGAQVILSTQSVTLLNEFDPEQVIVVDRSNGESCFRRLGSKELRTWLKNYTLGELWQKNAFEGGPAHE